MDRKNKIIIAICVLILFGFLFVIGFGERGAVDLYNLRLERDRLHEANLELRKKNQERYRTIERLKNDSDFVEEIARAELGMVREDEIIILKQKEREH